MKPQYNEYVYTEEESLGDDRKSLKIQGAGPRSISVGLSHSAQDNTLRAEDPIQSNCNNNMGRSK